MKRSLYPIILLLIPLLLPAQNHVSIANDPAIVSGRLTNGLTYYIVRNATEHKGFADFFMVLKCGSSVEAGPEAGMMEFLSEMSLYETRGFPDGSLFGMISDQGAIPDHAVIRHVGSGEVILGLKDIPVGSSGTVTDQALTVLLNLCSGAELTRDLCSGYGFDARQTKEFQKKWFRPDLQAIVINGDIDVNAIKEKISLLFLSIPRCTSPLPEMPADSSAVPTGMTDYDVRYDRGAGMAVLSFDFMHPALPDGQRATQVPLVQDFINSIMCQAIESRIRSFSGRLSFPLDTPEVLMGHFNGTSLTDDIRIRVRTTSDHICEAAGFLSCVLDHLTKGGISDTEFNTAAALYEDTGGRVTERSVCAGTDYYEAGCIRHFLEGYPLPSAEQKKLYTSKLRSSFDLKDMNAYMASFLNSDSHRIVRVLSPCPVPEEELARACASGPSEFASAMQAAASPILPARAQVSRLKAPVTEPVTSSQCFTLPNYARVYFKQNTTEPGRISLLAVSRGGLSIADMSTSAVRRYINDIAPLSVPDSPCPQKVSLVREFTPDRIYLRGSCTADELENLFKMVNACFLPCRIDENEFRKKMEELTMADVSGYDSPIWRIDRLTSGFLKEKRNCTPLDCHTASSFISRCFANIGSFSIFISGDCTQDRIKELTEAYLCPIPGKRVQLMPVPGTFSFDVSGADSHEVMEMDEPQTWYSLRLNGTCQYSLTDVFKSSVISSLIRQTMAETLFREGICAATYDEYFRYPSDRMSVGVRMKTQENLSYYRKALTDAVKQLSENGAPDSRIEMTKKCILNTVLRSEASQNEFWLGLMEARFNGKNFYAGREDAMAALTPTEVNQALKDFIKGASWISATVSPEEIIVPELPEIEYEDPFPAPLDMTFTLPESESVQDEETYDDQIQEEAAQNEETEEEISQAGTAGTSGK